MHELFYFNIFNVSIRLNSLECITEWDASGHSEPYLWPAFLKADATTIPGFTTPVDFQVPFEDQTGRGLFGNAGKDVKPGDVIEIPDSLGRFDVTLESYNLPIVGTEVMAGGFVVALIEDDGAPSDAMRAGHATFGQSLRDEINGFVSANLRFPNDEEIEEIQATISDEVKDAVKDKYSWYEKLFSPRDDFIGFVGGGETVFGAARLRNLSNQGVQQFRHPIRGTEKAIIPQYSVFIPVEVEHHYELNWQIEVRPKQPELAPIELELAREVEDKARQIHELDEAVDALVARLAEAETDKRLGVIAELDDRLKGKRAELVGALGGAWQEFAQARRKSASETEYQASSSVA